MPDLSTISSLSGEEITDAQIQGILNQIDLDIANLVRDGKLATAQYSVGAGTAGKGRFTNRADAIRSLKETREYYERLLLRRRAADEALPAISVSVVHDCDCP